VIKVKDVLKPKSDDELERIFENLSPDDVLKYSEKFPFNSILTGEDIDDNGNIEYSITISINRGNKRFIKKAKIKHIWAGKQ